MKSTTFVLAVPKVIITFQTVGGVVIKKSVAAGGDRKCKLLSYLCVKDLRKKYSYYNNTYQPLVQPGTGITPKPKAAIATTFISPSFFLQELNGVPLMEVVVATCKYV